MVVSCRYCVVETDGKGVVVVVADMMAIVVGFGQTLDIADGEDYDRDWYYLVVWSFVVFVSCFDKVVLDEIAMVVDYCPFANFVGCLESLRFC